jgi:3-methyl-2-oxobutanoate hydroxymethyltransferase
MALSHRLPIPTIGIGAGRECDGQVLVTQDLLGMLPGHRLKHVTPKLNAAELMINAVEEWRQALESATSEPS